MALERPDELGDIVPGEIITRFICRQDHIKADGTPKGLAFEESRLNLGYYPSVARENQYSEEEIWALGRDYVAATRNLNLLGRASLSVSDAESSKLEYFKVADLNILLEGVHEINSVDEIAIKVVPRPAPFPAHAEIKYTPFVKAIMKHICKKLAQSSQMHKPSEQHIKELRLHNLK